MGAADPSRQVADPLTPAEVLQRKRALWRTVRGIPARLQPVITFGMLTLGVCLGVLLGIGTGSPLTAFVASLVGALVLAVGQVWVQMYRETRAARELRALQDRWSIPVPDPETEALVTRIASDIAALPAQLRADFAPLVATVRECCTALAGAPADDRYLAMLRERAVLVRQVREEYDAVVASQHAREAMERFAGDTTGQDLALVAQMRDALAAVRAELGDAGPRDVADGSGEEAT
jgi:hypothetical protein